MNTSPFLTRSHLSPNPATTIFVNFTVSINISTPKQPLPLPLPLFTPSLSKSQISRLQQIQNSLARAVVKAPKSSHHSHPMLSALDKGNWTHWVQVPFTHIQSSQNNLTFTNLKDSNPLVPKTGTSSSINSPLLSPTTPSLFHSRLKTFLFHKSFPP